MLVCIFFGGKKNYEKSQNNVAYLIEEQKATENDDGRKGKIIDKHLTCRIGIRANRIIEALIPKNIKKK